MEDLPVFRAAKRRKHTRVQSDSGQALSPPEATRLPEDQLDGGDDYNQEVESTDKDVSSLVKARKQFRRPTTGVKFSNAKASRPGGGSGFGTTIAIADESTDRPIDITQRFVGSSGQVVDVDQHMFVPPFQVVDIPH